MGESICLVRSFSQPAEFSSRETIEVVPHRVESVSFGRFSKETLAWDKWSAFTQNRYLEEVERFTKPGSVAEKKAFFEAHFKNRAAGRVTQTKKIEEVKVKTCDEMLCDIPKDILFDSEVPLVVNNGMAMVEEVSNAEVESVVPSISEMDETTDVQIGEVKVINVENLNSVSVPEDKALDEEKSTSLGKERPPSSSGSKLEPSFAIGLDHSLKNTRKESSSSSKRSISVSKNRSRSPPEPFHMSNSCAPSGDTDKKIVLMPQKGSRSSTSDKGSVKADKKKRSDPSLVHVPLNFASSARQRTKRSPKKLARNSLTQETTSSSAKNSVFSNGNEPTEPSKSRKRPLPRTSKEGSKAAKCSTSASAVRLPKLPPSKNQLSENKRKNVSVRSSVSCRIPNNVQRQPSVSCENLTTHSKTKAKSITVSSPFVFRSGERAERRKEFFKKLEEKNKKEDHLVSEEHKNPQVGGFQVQQISLTSPKFRRNQTPGKENIKKSHRTPHKVSPIKFLNIKKAVMEKYKSCKIHPSSKLQTKIQTQENSSPNILQH